MDKRVFLIVLDSLGIGELPDACLWNDEGSHTLAAIASHPDFNAPVLKSLGLFNIDGLSGGVSEPRASFAKMAERSNGKDTTVGHWEIAGLISHSPLPTYPNGFSQEIIEEFERKTGRKTLCNKPYSGTEVIKDYGEEHIRTGALIVYTSADSVFQIAAHDSVISTEELYRYCEIAREMLKGEHAVGRVIARPFTGVYPFKRTPLRHDYSLAPPDKTMLDMLKENGLSVISVGKINDIFAGRGITEGYPTKSNADGMKRTLWLTEKDFNGLAFVNLVDFDSVYGHRNDIKGYAGAVSGFDIKLGELLSRLRENDILIITADHGCDPSTPSTDHSREYTPMLIYGSKIKSGVDLGVRESFSDISATVLDIFGIGKGETAGSSFYKNVIKEKIL